MGARCRQLAAALARAAPAGGAPSTRTAPRAGPPPESAAGQGGRGLAKHRVYYGPSVNVQGGRVGEAGQKTCPTREGHG